MARITDPALIAQLETSQTAINKGTGGAALPPASLDEARRDAIAKMRLAMSLKRRSKDTWFGTGFGANVARHIGGTGAYDIDADTQTLKSGGALRKILQMAADNDGKNPLTPMSEADVETIANSTANLDTGQSDDQFQRNVGQYEQAYRSAFGATGGQEADLPPDLRAHAKTTPVTALSPKAAAYLKKYGAH